MGDPKGLEALKKKILLDHGIDEHGYVSSEECANLISEDMAEFQKPKNAQMLPYDEAKWEVPFERLQFQGFKHFFPFFFSSNFSIQCNLFQFFFFSKFFATSFSIYFFTVFILFQNHWVKATLEKS